MNGVLVEFVKAVMSVATIRVTIGAQIKVGTRGTLEVSRTIAFLETSIANYVS